jgi:hypothetical protein
MRAGRAFATITSVVLTGAILAWPDNVVPVAYRFIAPLWAESAAPTTALPDEEQQLPDYAPGSHTLSFSKGAVPAPTASDPDAAGAPAASGSEAVGAGREPWDKPDRVAGCSPGRTELRGIAGPIPCGSRATITTGCSGQGIVWCCKIGLAVGCARHRYLCTRVPSGRRCLARRWASMAGYAPVTQP